MNKFCKMLLTVVVVGIASSMAHAAVILGVSGPNPQGVPTNGGTGFFLTLDITDSIPNGTLHAGNLSVSNALHDTLSAAAAAILVKNDIMFESEIGQVENLETVLGVADADRYLRRDDSYYRDPWEVISGANLPMSVNAASHGEFGAGDKVSGPTTVALAYVNVPNGGVISIQGTIARTSDAQFGATLNHTLDSSGNLIAIPEPSAFLFLGVLAVGLVVRTRVKKSRSI